MRHISSTFFLSFFEPDITTNVIKVTKHESLMNKPKNNLIRLSTRSLGSSHNFFFLFFSFYYTFYSCRIVSNGKHFFF